MPYNSTSINNLQPFTGQDDPRRQNGRKAGSKNIKTITRELLEKEVDLTLPINEEIKAYLNNNSSYSYTEAITLAMIIKAINGDTGAARLIFERSEKLNIDDSDGFFNQPEIVFQVVPSPHTDPEKYAEFKQWQQFKQEMREQKPTSANLE